MRHFRAAKTDLQQGWYKTGLDLFPLLRINKIRAILMPEPQGMVDPEAPVAEPSPDDPLVEYDLFAQDESSPTPMLAAASELARYHLKPATEQDFEEAGMERLTQNLLLKSVKAPEPEAV
jgi:hypothetical protein